MFIPTTGPMISAARNIPSTMSIITAGQRMPAGGRTAWLAAGAWAASAGAAWDGAAVVGCAGVAVAACGLAAKPAVHAHNTTSTNAEIVLTLTCASSAFTADEVRLRPRTHGRG